VRKTRFLILLFLISSLFSAFCYKDDSKDLNLTEFGYIGKHWDTDIITLSVKLKNESFYYKFCGSNKKLKISIVKEGIVDNSNILEFYNFIIKNKILKLKSVSIFDPKTNSDDFESLYKEKLPDQHAFIYEFYFIIDKKKYRFKIDDVKNISEKRYLILLKKMNEIPEKPNFLNIFDFLNYTNKRGNK